MIEGLTEDLSQRFDTYLTHTYVAEPPNAYRHAKPKRRAKKTVRR